jgi:hypothetical protein
LSRFARLERVAKRSPMLRKAYHFWVNLNYRTRHRRSTLEGGSPAKDRVNPANVIWIFCTARSGSTWLKRMLHELVPSEVWNEPKVSRLFGDFYAGVDQALYRSPSFVMGDPTRQVWTRAVRHFVLETAWASHPSITPEQYLIVKEPGGAIGAPLLMEALPESRMVLLVRDPRDFVASLLDASREGGWIYEQRDESKRRKVPLDEKGVRSRVRTLSNQYVRQISNGKKAFDAHRGPKALIRYEDLRADTFGTMWRLCSALEIPTDEQSLARAVKKYAWENIPQEEKGPGKIYRKATPGGWREDLTPEQAKIVEVLAAPLIEEFYGQPSSA